MINLTRSSTDERGTSIKNLETCYERIKHRDASAHLPVSEELLKSINEKAAGVNLNWDLIIDNTDLVTTSEIKKLLNNAMLS